MPKQAKGEMRWGADGGTARITIKGKHRESYPLPTCKTRDQAEERMLLLSSMAQRFRRAGVIDTRDARQLLETAASCAPALLPGVLQVAGELAGGKLEDASKPEVPTFEQMAAKWTSGELNRDFPDYVKSKDAELDKSRLKKLCAIDLGGMRAGDIPLDRFTLEHAEQMMRKLPDEVERPATRRQYALLIHRTLSLGVYPCKHLKVTPLPKGFLPKVGKPPAFPYLYPDEEAKLMAHRKTPLCFRVLLGFLSREGCREGEAYAMQVRDVDLERGVVKLDQNKTDDPRSWALDAGVTRALDKWVKSRGAQPEDFLFVDESGGVMTGDHRLAELLRGFLWEAGVRRHELHNDGTNTGKLRVHDLRAGFVTVRLATGKTETWVQDRTGHTTSEMINRYRRQAREAAELDLGDFKALDQAIPEMTPETPHPAPSPPRLPHHRPKIRAPRRIRTYDPRIRSPESSGDDQEASSEAVSAKDEHERRETGLGQDGAIDAVEAALADAITKAAAAGAFDVLPKLVAELEARRKARAGTVDLAAERAKRGRS